MSQLIAAMQAAGLTGTPAQIVAAFDGAGTPVMDNTSYSMSGIGGALAAKGVDVSILIGLREHIDSLPIGGHTLEGFLIAGGGTSGGVDCSRADIRYQIQANQAHPSTTSAQQAILAGMLLVGYSPRKLWEQHGLMFLPTVDEVSDALDEMSTREKCDYVTGNVIPGALAAGKTWDEIQVLIAAVE